MMIAQRGAMAAVSVDSLAVVVRDATSADVEALVVLENKAFETDRLSRRSFRQLIGGSTASCILAEAGGVVVGYALNLFRSGTALARLYSIAVTPEYRGHAIGERLLAAAEVKAYEHGSIFLRLEVRSDNQPAIALYRRKGYREFGRFTSYYEDGCDALRFEKRLLPPAPRGPASTPYYAQTTDFTCGAACMMMALARFEPTPRLDRTRELRLWRESTVIYMAAGHGGCEPFGMAAALARRGLRTEIYLNQRGPLLLDSVRDPDKREVMALTQADFRDQAAELNVPVHYRQLRRDQLLRQLDAGCVVIMLVSSYRMFREKTPHWVVIHDHDGDHVFVHDPWIETEGFESETAAADLPIPIDEFERMAQYGRSKLRAAVVVAGLGVESQRT
jgi:ribosomal protein S18 acetylase RimI-like enzyme